MNLRESLIRGLRFVDAAISDHLGPIRILFIISDIRGFAQIVPLVRSLSGRPRILVRFVLDPNCPIGVDELDEFGEQCPETRSALLERAKAEFGKWHYVFSTDVTQLLFRRAATRFMLHHGQTWGNLDRPQRFGEGGEFDDYSLKMARHYQVSMRQLVSVGEFDYFARQAPDLMASPDYRAVIVGVPKLDGYRRLSDGERRVRRIGLGVDPDQTVVVVTSHWTRKGLLASLGRAVIEALLGCDPDIRIVLLGHEKFWRDAQDGADARATGVLQEIQALAECEPRLMFVPCSPDQVRYLELGDVFVCDNSSAFVECLLFDRPMLFFDHPEFQFTDDNVGAAYRSAAESFRSCRELAERLPGALADRGARAQRREQALRFLLSHRGGSTEFLVGLIERLGRLSGPQSLRWRRACDLIDRANAELADTASQGR